jgi:uncharacterized protein (DUF58 family)
MIDQNIRHKIKKIKIHTKRIMQSAIAGDYLSAFKGAGLEFHQIREYQLGDDVRAIDWNSSAKMNKMMIKQFIEERDRTVILAIDVSGSTNYSSQKELRTETIAQLAGTLAFVASQNKDKVGAFFFSDVIEKWIPPSKGNVHIGKIIEQIFSIKPNSKKTDIASALKFLINIKKRNAVVFMISDWIDASEKFHKLLKVASCEYDLVGIRLIDPCEQVIPSLGIMDIQDSETNTRATINTTYTSRGTNQLTVFLQTRLIEQKRLFDKYRIDLLDLTVAQPFINPLIKFFHQRIRRQI